MSCAATSLVPNHQGASATRVRAPVIRDNNLKTLTDDALVSRARSGNLDAFEVLLGATKRSCFG